MLVLEYHINLAVKSAVASGCLRTNEEIHSTVGSTGNCSAVDSATITDMSITSDRTTRNITPWPTSIARSATTDSTASSISATSSTKRITSAGTTKKIVAVSLADDISDLYCVKDISASGPGWDTSAVGSGRDISAVGPDRDSSAVGSDRDTSAVGSGRDISAATTKTTKDRISVGSANNISADRTTRNISPFGRDKNMSTVGNTLETLTTTTARNVLATSTDKHSWDMCSEEKRSAVCSAKKERAVYIGNIVSKLQRTSPRLIRRSEAIENLLGVMWNDERYLKGIGRHQANSSALKRAPVSSVSSGKAQLLKLASELMFKRRQASTGTQHDTIFVPMKTKLAPTEVQVLPRVKAMRRFKAERSSRPVFRKQQQPTQVGILQRAFSYLSAIYHSTYS